MIVEALHDLMREIRVLSSPEYKFLERLSLILVLRLIPPILLRNLCYHSPKRYSPQGKVLLSGRVSA